jgi:hypothetical protein
MNDRDQTTADEKLAKQAKALFDASVDSLDAGTRSRLNQSRQAALAEPGTGRRILLQWAPAAGVVAATVIAAVLWTGNRPPEPIAPEAAAADVEILLDEDSLEMLEELEFYSWIELAEEPAAGPQTDDQIG